jgi:hypothetical protein
LRFTVASEHTPSTPGNTETLSARAVTGSRSHATNRPTSSSRTPDHETPRWSRNSNQSRRSWAYALTVFGDRSTACRCDKNPSTGSTTAASRSTSVHDSGSPNGITTGCTRSPGFVTHTEDNQSTTRFPAPERRVGYIVNSFLAASDNQ